MSDGSVLPGGLRADSYGFLRALLETPSPSGFERRGQQVWCERVAAFAAQVESDAYGNAFATFHPGGAPRILLGGHGDELGLMVAYISDEGFIHVRGIGGVDRGLLRGQRVVVHGRSGPVPGVVGSLAIHMQEPDDRKKVPEWHEIFLDIGAASREEAEKLVRVGDAVTVGGGPCELAGSRLAARGCDNRIGTWAVAEALRILKEEGRSCEAEVVAVSTIQEENGLYGASMAAYRLRPDVALVVDVTHATDIPACSKPKHGDIRLGKGPVISFGSANHPAVCEKLLEVAAAEGIPVQLEANPRSTGTDADAMFLQRGGIPTATIGLPNRYMHSPVEVIDLGDLAALARLLAAFCFAVKPGEAFRVEIQQHR